MKQSNYSLNVISFAGVLPARLVKSGIKIISLVLLLVMNTAAATGEPPVIRGQPPSSVRVGETYSFIPTASDPEGDDLRFFIQGLRAWMDFDSFTGELSGTPQDSDVRLYTNIIITVSDGTNFTATDEFSIEVLPLPNEAPAIEADNFQILLGASFSFTPTITDPDGDELEVQISTPPQWGSVQISENTLAYTAPDEVESGVTTDTFSLIVSDGRDGSEPAEFSVALVSASSLITNEVFVQQRVAEEIYFIDALQNVPQNLGDTFTLGASFSPFGATQVDQGGTVRLALDNSGVNAIPINVVVQNSEGEYLLGQATLVLKN